MVFHKFTSGPRRRWWIPGLSPTQQRGQEVVPAPARAQRSEQETDGHQLPWNHAAPPPVVSPFLTVIKIFQSEGFYPKFKYIYADDLTFIFLACKFLQHSRSIQPTLYSLCISFLAIQTPHPQSGCRRNSVNIPYTFFSFEDYVFLKDIIHPIKLAKNLAIILENPRILLSSKILFFHPNGILLSTKNQGQVHGTI